VYSETTGSEWRREDRIFSGEGKMKGRFPGPWDEVPTQDRMARR
jgi:hypothetical protein